MNYSDFVASRIKSPMQLMKEIDIEKMNLIHMGMGVAGEALELMEAIKEDHIVEELGDLLFYLYGIVSLPFPKYNIPRHTSIASVCSTCEKLFNTIKKHCIYNKNLNGEIEELANLAIAQITMVASSRGLSLAELQEANKAKLLKRYPNGYCDSMAEKRLDKQ